MFAFRKTKFDLFCVKCKRFKHLMKKVAKGGKMRHIRTESVIQHTPSFSSVGHHFVSVSMFVNELIDVSQTATTFKILHPVRDPSPYHPSHRNAKQNSSARLARCVTTPVSGL